MSSSEISVYIASPEPKFEERRLSVRLKRKISGGECHKTGRPPVALLISPLRMLDGVYKERDVGGSADGPASMSAALLSRRSSFW